MNVAEILERGRAGNYGPEVQALFLDPNPDVAVQTLVVCFLAMPGEGRNRLLAQMKQERSVAVSLDGFVGGGRYEHKR